MARPHALYAALWVAGVALFAGMAALAAAYDTFPADVWLAQRFQDVRSDALDWLLDATADLAKLPLIVVPTLVAAGGFYLAGGRRPALLVLGTLAARLLNSGVKEVVDRPRPSADLVDFSSQPGDPSFPSGHANNAILFYGLVIYLAAVYIPDRRIRLPVQALSAWMAVGASVQRVYAGHHWPSDVIGGFLLGCLVLAVFIAVHRFVLRPRPAVTYRHPVRS